MNWWRRRLIVDRRTSVLAAFNWSLFHRIYSATWSIHIPRDGSVMSAICSGNIIHRSVYRQHTDVGADRGSQWTAVVQQCTTETAASWELSTCQTPIVEIKWSRCELRKYRIWTSSRLFHWNDMWCLTAEEEYRDLLCRRLLRDPATPGQTDSTFNVL